MDPEGKNPKVGEEGADENEGIVGCFVERLVLAQEERTKGRGVLKGATSVYVVTPSQKSTRSSDEQDAFQSVWACGS